MTALHPTTWIVSMLEGLALLTMADPRPAWDDFGPMR
jgi:hypothetical protein